MRSRWQRAEPQAFFGPSDRPEPGDRRLLLISMAFPPDPITGSLRWQKLAAHVAERGWGLDVVTVDPSSVESPDWSRLAELPAGTRVYGVSTRAPVIERIAVPLWKAYRRLRSANEGGRRRRLGAAAAPATMRSSGADAASSSGTTAAASFNRHELPWTWRNPRELVRAYAAWVEFARSGRWARDAAALALRVIEPGVHKAVITSGPPHMAHEAGRSVSRVTGLPFVMDMRDPWSLVQRIPEPVASPVWLRLADRYERRGVGQAALIVANTEPFRLAMCARYPEAGHRVITVMNGCDTDAVPPSCHGGRFTIGYAGTIYLDRDPRLLFRAAARVIGDLALEPTDFGIDFLGHVDQYGSMLVSDIAREERVDRFVTLEPKRPRRAALEFLARATMLVALPQDSDMAIPAKIFEYVQFDAWVLALATHDSATGRLLRGTGADVVPPDDFEGLVGVIRQRFLQYRNGVRPRRLAQDARFSRRVQAQRLLDAIESCAGEPRSTPAHGVLLGA